MAAQHLVRARDLVFDEDLVSARDLVSKTAKTVGIAGHLMIAEVLDRVA